jgi:branched-chain amino acid transport system permease protein
MCNAVRENPERAQFVGYNPQRVRWVAFSVAALFAGLAGGLHAINYEIVSSEALGPLRSGDALLMSYIGGAGHFFGPILGAAVITWLQVSLSDYTQAWQLYFGLLFIGMVLFAPGGLAGLIQMHVPLVRRRTLHTVLAAYVAALPGALLLGIGSTLLLEMAYRTATRPELGGKFTVLGIELDARTVTPWLAGAAIVVVGFFAFRAMWPRIRRAWERATAPVATESAPAAPIRKGA